MYATTAVYGKIFDNCGPKPLSYFGTLVHVFGLMMASLSTKYYQFFLAQSICSALGAAACSLLAQAWLVGGFLRKGRWHLALCLQVLLQADACYRKHFPRFLVAL